MIREESTHCNRCYRHDQAKLSCQKLNLKIILVTFHIRVLFPGQVGISIPIEFAFNHNNNMFLTYLYIIAMFILDRVKKQIVQLFQYHNLAILYP